MGQTGQETGQKLSQENGQQFETRKMDHINLSLDPRTEASELNDLDQVELIHEALPDINFDQIDIGIRLFNTDLSAPMFVSSMTAGHSGSLNINTVLATVCSQRNWAMGVGSQRRELSDLLAPNEWKQIRKKVPHIKFIGNIGITQLITTSVDEIQRLVDGLQAFALFVHTNPLQECLQPEGTPQFAGALKALEKLCKKISVPVILKEVGCGFSQSTLERLKGIGLAAVDVAGLGGTHWGRIEGFRSPSQSQLYQAAQTFKSWGISTAQSLLNGKAIHPDYELWASGGVRTGLDVAKLLALGAQMVGLARPLLEAALNGEESLNKKMELLEFELKIAMFCVNCATLKELRSKKVWKI